MTNSQKSVLIPMGDIDLEGDLVIPPKAKGLVLFAHGSGSSRHSARNRYVAEELNKVQIATFLFDLLSREEDVNYETRFDIDLLAERLEQSTSWILKQEEVKHLPLAYFGASTGAAAALKAAALLGSKIKCVVSRGGRPDLASEALEEVSSPTLLIVGGEDDVVIELNRSAYAHLSCPKELVIVPGATHLFEEPGTLEEVARLASTWFKKYLI